MSCVYCDPKSRMRIFSEWMSTAASAPRHVDVDVVVIDLDPVPLPAPAA
jgi:hypothetical protein